jgi:hypothetical protein
MKQQKMKVQGGEIKLASTRIASFDGSGKERMALKYVHPEDEHDEKKFEKYETMLKATLFHQKKKMLFSKGGLLKFRLQLKELSLFELTEEYGSNAPAILELAQKQIYKMDWPKGFNNGLLYEKKRGVRGPKYSEEEEKWLVFATFEKTLFGMCYESGRTPLAIRNLLGRKYGNLTNLVRLRKQKQVPRVKRKYTKRKIVEMEIDVPVKTGVLLPADMRNNYVEWCKVRGIRYYLMERKEKIDWAIAQIDSQK